jgi:hypothetical protein
MLADPVFKEANRRVADQRGGCSGCRTPRDVPEQVSLRARPARIWASVTLDFDIAFFLEAAEASIFRLCMLSSGYYATSAGRARIIASACSY